MKYLFFIFLFTLAFCYSCCLQQKVALSNSIFESNKKDAFGSSKLLLGKDSTFIFYGQGPSVLLSTGSWSYNANSRELLFKSDIPNSRFIHPTTIDTFWIDISSKTGRLVQKDRLVIDDVLYYKKQ